jgi:Flp pilus assembly protein TadG
MTGQPANARRAATIPETTFILIPLLACLLAIFEYGRFLMDGTLLDNAAREGCRYALVNNTSTTISTDVQNQVRGYMAGRDASFTTFTISVSGTHNGAATAVNNLTPGDLITVTVSGTYPFLNIIPFYRAPSTLNMSSSVTMVCEGAT